MVDAALRAAGHQIGAVHVAASRRSHRAVRHRRPASTREDELSRAVDRVRDASSSICSAAGALDVHPTFFEVTTAAAFELFRRASVEVAVCEVGLGGRLDATNVLSPMVTAITSIALDHQQYLGTIAGGDRRREGRHHQAGVPVVVGTSGSRRGARDRGCRARPGGAAGRGRTTASTSKRCRLRPTAARRFAFARRDATTACSILRLAGRHQIDNAIVAVRVLEVLDAAGTAVPRRRRSPTDWRPCTGRDGSSASASPTDARCCSMRRTIRPAPKRSRRSWPRADARQPLVFAAMRDKDVRGILAALVPLRQRVWSSRARRIRAPPTRAALLDTASALASGLPMSRRGFACARAGACLAAQPAHRRRRIDFSPRRRAEGAAAVVIPSDLHRRASWMTTPSFVLAGRRVAARVGVTAVCAVADQHSPATTSSRSRRIGSTRITGC